LDQCNEILWIDLFLFLLIDSIMFVSKFSGLFFVFEAAQFWVSLFWLEHVD